MYAFFEPSRTVIIIQDLKIGGGGGEERGATKSISQFRRKCVQLTRPAGAPRYRQYEGPRFLRCPLMRAGLDSIRRYKTRYTTAAVPRLLTRQWPCSMAKKAFRFISDKPFFLLIAVPTGFSAPRVFNSPAS